MTGTGYYNGNGDDVDRQEYLRLQQEYEANPNALRPRTVQKYTQRYLETLRNFEQRLLHNQNGDERGKNDGVAHSDAANNSVKGHECQDDFAVNPQEVEDLENKIFKLRTTHAYENGSDVDEETESSKIKSKIIEHTFSPLVNDLNTVSHREKLRLNLHHYYSVFEEKLMENPFTEKMNEVINHYKRLHGSEVINADDKRGMKFWKTKHETHQI